MIFPDNPIITKFFTNKIESSNNDWPDYLLEIANVFYQMDGQEYDKDLLLEHFTALSQRSPYTLRDAANFRDEFGAYGPYLGLFRLEIRSGRTFIFISETTKQLLCSTEPDVEAFCKAQLSLFQYPNGAGGAPHISQTGMATVRVQANVLKDTTREVANNIRIVPFRLICRALLAKIRSSDLRPVDVELSYRELFALFNDSRTNTNPNPSFDSILDVCRDLNVEPVPSWFNQTNLRKFKRNFHIFEQTGLLIRTSNGLKVVSNNYDTLNMIESIAEMTSFFQKLNYCSDISQVNNEIQNLSWGKYYDSIDVLTSGLMNQIAEDTTSIAESESIRFPEMITYDSNISNKVKYSSFRTTIDPEITRLKKEKANRDHARILNLIATHTRYAGGIPYENIFIDLFVELNNMQFIFEVKSCNSDNVLSQIRKGISQLYEYRFRSNYHDAVLCLVLQTKPEDWLIDYLINDRDIHCCWLEDDLNLFFPTESQSIFSSFFP